jgi:hypothetical protein
MRTPQWYSCIPKHARICGHLLRELRRSATLMSAPEVRFQEIAVRKRRHCSRRTAIFRWPRLPDRRYLRLAYTASSKSLSIPTASLSTKGRNCIRITAHKDDFGSIQ